MALPVFLSTVINTLMVAGRGKGRLSKGSLYHAKTGIAQANYHMPQYCPTHTHPVKNYTQARQNTQSFLMYPIFLVSSAPNVPYCVVLNIFINKKTPTNTKTETKRKVNTHKKRETVTQTRTKTPGTEPELAYKKKL